MILASLNSLSQWNFSMLKGDKTLDFQGGSQSEFPTNETLVGFGDSSGVGFEKVDGFFLIYNVAVDIWISKLDFHMYSQQPPKLSNQNEVWKLSKRPPLCVYLDFPFVLPGASKSEHFQKQCTMYIFSEICIEISQFLCPEMVYLRKKSKFVYFCQFQALF